MSPAIIIYYLTVFAYSFFVGFLIGSLAMVCFPSNTLLIVAMIVGLNAAFGVVNYLYILPWVWKTAHKYIDDWYKHGVDR